MRRAAVAAAVLVTVLAAGAAAWALAPGSMAVEVPPGVPVARVVAGVPEGTLVRLLPGEHAPFAVGRSVSIVGASGAVVRGPVEITADGVRLADVEVRGGGNGITVHEAEGVVLEGVRVVGAELHGIEVASGSATVRDCAIGGMVSPYAQAFEVRNSTGMRRTIVEGCEVDGGMEGIVSHVSRVEFRGNVVRGTTSRAIAVTEMSEGLVEANVVQDVAGAGIYCGDQSHCEIRDNTVRGVAAIEGGPRSAQGYGIVGWYQSILRIERNHLEGLAAPEPVRIALRTITTAEFPLGIWPTGWRGAIPGFGVAAIAMAAILGVRVAVEPLVRRRRRAGIGRALGEGAVGALVAGLVVQSFHMLEHVVQVFQVYVADAEVRSGLLGRAVDTEWVHFTYNVVVLGFLAWAAWALSRSDLAPRHAVAFVLAALLIQTYHAAEHVAKLVQHLSTGVDPAPGIIGARLGLVWFHFGINLAVYLGFAVAAVLVLRVRGARGPRAAVVAGAPG